MTQPLGAPKVTASITTKIMVSVKLSPGFWIMGLWSITDVMFEVYRDDSTGRWFTHLSPAGFRAVRRPDNYRGNHHGKMGHWARNPVFPGFTPRIEHVPLAVIQKVRETYEDSGISPEVLPPMDAATGKGPAR